MRDSHFKTPRTLAECDFTVGHERGPFHRPETLLEKIAGYALAIAIGTSLAVLLVVQLSK